MGSRWGMKLSRETGKGVTTRYTCERVMTYLEQERIFADPLDRFDEKRWEFGFCIDQMVMILTKKMSLSQWHLFISVTMRFCSSASIISDALV